MRLPFLLEPHFKLKLFEIFKFFSKNSLKVLEMLKIMLYNVMDKKIERYENELFFT